MPTVLKLAEILSLNPQLDAERLAAGRDMLRRLRGNGLRGRGYQLAVPFSGRHAFRRDLGDRDRSA
jgi:hypothetical protein